MISRHRHLAATLFVIGVFGSGMAQSGKHESCPPVLSYSPGRSYSLAARILRAVYKYPTDQRLQATYQMVDRSFDPLYVPTRHSDDAPDGFGVLVEEYCFRHISEVRPGLVVRTEEVLCTSIDPKHKPLVGAGFLFTNGPYPLLNFNAGGTLVQEDQLATDKNRCRRLP